MAAESGSPRESQESITVEITGAALAALRELARERNLDLDDALIHALGNQLVIAREIAGGSKILIAKPDRSLQELLPA